MQHSAYTQHMIVNNFKTTVPCAFFSGHFADVLNVLHGCPVMLVIA